MNRKTGAVVLAAVAASLCGCGMEQRVVAHRTETSKTWFGDMGITGHLNRITVQSGSRVDLMSILGDGNKVFVEDGSTLGKVEIFGENNVVSIPGSLIVRDSRVGHGNIIERRPVEPRATPMSPAPLTPSRDAMTPPGGAPATSGGEDM